MRSAEVRLEQLTKRYHGTLAVDHVSLGIAPGSMLALLGPSGCGKTTCLRMIAGLVSPSAGEIYVNGAPISRLPVHRRNIGMLFQNYALFPHMTVAENVAFGLKMRRLGRTEVAERVAAALAMVQLSPLASRLPAQLSGGQQQRVALARALVIEPAMLLLDEPLGALDKGLRESMQVELRALQHRLGITAIMVTHDQDEALTMADTIVVMRAGRLEQAGSPAEIYQKPANRFVAGFLGVSNFLTCSVGDSRDGVARLKVPGGAVLQTRALPPGQREVTVSIRPEAISVVAPPPEGSAIEPNAMVATVEQLIYRGSVSQYYLRSDDGEPLIAFQQNRSNHANATFDAGSRVLAHWGPDSIHVLPSDGSAASA